LRSYLSEWKLPGGIDMYDGTATGDAKRVLIADRLPMFRLGLVTYLRSIYPSWHILEADALPEQRSQLGDGSTDLLIVEGRLFGREIDEHPSAVRDIGVDIIAITEPEDVLGARGCLCAGARATISRSDSASQIHAIIDGLVSQPRPDRSVRAYQTAAGEPPAEAWPRDRSLNLTARQFQVLQSLAKGHSNKVIARDLDLSVSTVKVHLNTVFRALGASNRLEAVLRARPFQDRVLVREQ
jgi:two-component system, NarL family, nitrate/nitrite response regulator NarL